MTAHGILSQVKSCIKCGAQDRRPNGSCRACAKITKAAYRKANREKLRLENNAYRKANPERVKTYDATWYEKNRDKKKASCREWRASNKDVLRACIDSWNRNNPSKLKAIRANRRARLKGGNGVLSPGLADKLFKLQKGKCPCCKQPLGDDYHLDHKMPLALGGSNTDDNMQLMRARCNLQKNALHPIDFMQWRGFLL